MAGAGIYSFSEEQEWDDILSNPLDIRHAHDHDNAKLEVELDVTDLLINDCEDTNELIIAPRSSFNVDMHAIEDYLMDSHLQTDNNNVVRDQQDDQYPHRHTMVQLEIDDDIFISIEDMDMIDCFNDSPPPELMASHDDSTVSDNVTNTNSSNRSVGTAVKEFSSVDNGRLQEVSESSEIEYKGLRLLHLLAACAEAISKGSHDLVEVILLRLRGLVSPTGSTMERVAYYLCHSLHYKIHPLGHTELDQQAPSTDARLQHFLGAFKLLHQVYPYIRMAHFTANQCILEAITTGASNSSGHHCISLHIIDFDIMEGIQWPPLMEALKSGDYTVGHMKITAIKRDDDEHNNSLLYSVCKQTGTRLAECAESLGIPFSFEEKGLQNLKEIETCDDDIVAVNCMWGLPHMNERPKLQVWEFLEVLSRIKVDTLTIATGPHGVESETPGDFLDRFSGCLKNLCTVFDSLEAGLPEHGLARAIVERFFFGPNMCRFVVRNCEDQELGLPKVVDIPLKCGFIEGVMSKESMMHANYVVSCCREGGKYYGVELVGDHELFLKWGSTPLVWVSTWESP